MKLSTSGTPQDEARVLARLTERLEHWLGQLAAAKPFARSGYQTEVFQVAETLMRTEEGLAALYEHAPKFPDAHVFTGGPWEDVSKLQPPLVKGSLAATGVYPIVETLSELRVLAIATGRLVSPKMTAADAREFLNETMALNLEYVFPGHTEQERIEGGPHYASHTRLFALIAKEIGLSALRSEVVGEVEQVSAQRPVMTRSVRTIIKMAARIPSERVDDEVGRRLAVFAAAIDRPTPLSRDAASYADYRAVLKSADASALEAEAQGFASSMRQTGLAAPFHAVLLRHIRRAAKDLLPIALDLNELGLAELNQKQEFVEQMIQVAIYPGTTQSIYGLKRVLERGLLSRQAVVAGLNRLVGLDLTRDVKRTLLQQRARKDGNTANSMLVAGALSVLGSPLGVGQGRNPTCQAARGISLWAQHAPGYLLELVISAARDGVIEIAFEGTQWRSDTLHSVKVLSLDLELDPISLVLVPHLDRLYDQFMKLVALRPEDGHKWVNPALYGRWVPTGFASVFSDTGSSVVTNYDDFVRRFFATHHPAYNAGHRLMYPNPVGLCVTNSHGEYLGPHAVSLQRIEPGPDGRLRAYFYNPNNEGRQNWGQDTRPAVTGNDERPGESSLPFEQFIARLYAFHYNPYEEGDAYAVPDVEIERIEEEARSTWGRTFVWEPAS